MSTISATIAASIERHHLAAQLAATTAVANAKAAGILLLQVKASLPHGEWLPWLAANVKVSARQAQRYIAVAEGRTPPLRELAEPVTEGHPCQAVTGDGASRDVTPSHATDEESRQVTPESHATPAGVVPKNDTVSHLPAEWQNPAFLPTPGMWHMGSGFYIEPSSAHPGHWFISHVYDDPADPTEEGIGSLYDCTRRPIKAYAVSWWLKQNGCADPAAVEWLRRPSPGVRVAMETWNTPETTAQRLQEERDYITGKRSDAEHGIHTARQGAAA